MPDVTRILSQIEAGDPAAPQQLLPLAAGLVKLRYFAGLSVEQAAETLGLSRTAAYRHWTYARAWLFAQTQVHTGKSSAGPV